MRDSVSLPVVACRFSSLAALPFSCTLLSARRAPVNPPGPAISPALRFGLFSLMTPEPGAGQSPEAQQGTGSDAWERIRSSPIGPAWAALSAARASSPPGTELSQRREQSLWPQGRGVPGFSGGRDYSYGSPGSRDPGGAAGGIDWAQWHSLIKEARERNKGPRARETPSRVLRSPRPAAHSPGSLHEPNASISISPTKAQVTHPRDGEFYKLLDDEGACNSAIQRAAEGTARDRAKALVAVLKSQNMYLDHTAPERIKLESNAAVQSLRNPPNPQAAKAAAAHEPVAAKINELLNKMRELVRCHKPTPSAHKWLQVAVCPKGKGKAPARSTLLPKEEELQEYRERPPSPKSYHEKSERSESRENRGNGEGGSGRSQGPPVLEKTHSSAQGPRKPASVRRAPTAAALEIKEIPPEHMVQQVSNTDLMAEEELGETPKTPPTEKPKETPKEKPTVRKHLPKLERRQPTPVRAEKSSPPREPSEERMAIEPVAPVRTLKSSKTKTPDDTEREEIEGDRRDRAPGPRKTTRSSMQSLVSDGKSLSLRSSSFLQPAKREVSQSSHRSPHRPAPGGHLSNSDDDSSSFSLGEMRVQMGLHGGRRGRRGSDTGDDSSSTETESHAVSKPSERLEDHRSRRSYEDHRSGARPTRKREYERDKRDDRDESRKSQGRHERREIRRNRESYEIPEGQSTHPIHSTHSTHSTQSIPLAHATSTTRATKTGSPEAGGAQKESTRSRRPLNGEEIFKHVADPVTISFPSEKDATGVADASEPSQDAQKRSTPRPQAAGRSQTGSSSLKKAVSGKPSHDKERRRGESIDEEQAPRPPKTEKARRRDSAKQSHPNREEGERAQEPATRPDRFNMEHSDDDSKSSSDDGGENDFFNMGKGRRNRRERLTNSSDDHSSN